MFLIFSRTKPSFTSNQRPTGRVRSKHIFSKHQLWKYALISVSLRMLTVTFPSRAWYNILEPRASILIYLDRKHGSHLEPRRLARHWYRRTGNRLMRRRYHLYSAGGHPPEIYEAVQSLSSFSPCEHPKCSKRVLDSRSDV